MRILTRVAYISASLLLSGCSGEKVHKVRESLIGKPWSEVVSCIGVPSKTSVIDDKMTVVQWEYEQDKVSGTLSMAALAAFATPVLAIPASVVSGNAFSISGAGNCLAVGTVSDHQLTALKFSGDNTTLMSGRDGVCEPLFRGCV